MYRTLLLLLLTALTSSLALRQLTSEPEEDAMVRLTRDKENNMKTFHVLQELDDFYSKLYRPSLPGGDAVSIDKRDSGIKPKHYQLLRNLDEKYAHRYRPRFGKRTSIPSRPSYSEEEPSILSRLLRQR